MRRLLANNALVNLLYYTNKDPLNQPYLTEKQKETEVFNKLIKIIPRIGPKEDSKSMISIRVTNGTKITTNTEFRAIQIVVEVFVPLTQWIMKGTNLRPFAILGEVEESLNGKTVNGLGKMEGGDFTINFLTEEIVCYEQVFYITQYE